MLVKTILFTFEQSLASVFVAIAAGLPGAFFISRRTFIFKKLFISLKTIPLCIPAMIACLGYISTFGYNGIINQIIIKIFHLNFVPLKFLYSFWGIAIVQGFYNFPLILISTSDALTSIDSSQEDSARLLGAGELRIFFTITIPRIIPSIITGAIPVFIFCYFSFMIIMMLGIPGTVTMETAVYFSARTFEPFSRTFKLAMTETLLAFIILFFYSLIENKSSRIKNSAQHISIKEPVPVKGIELILFSLYFLVIILFFILPFASIITSSFTSSNGGIFHFSLRNWYFIFKMPSFFNSLYSTAVQSTITALLCTVAGFIFCIFIRFNTFKKAELILKNIPLIPLAISSVVTGFLLNSFFIFFNYTPVMMTLVIAQTLLYWPFAYRQIYSSIKSIPDEVIFSARLFSTNPFKLIFSVILPNTFNSIISAFLFSFAISAGDATLPFILSIPDYNCLALFTYRLFGYRFPAACCSSVILGSLCMLLCILAESIKNKHNILKGN